MRALWKGFSIQSKAYDLEAHPTSSAAELNFYDSIKY